MPVKDCVIGCPVYFDDAQRHALMKAAKLAKLNVLRLMNETTAIALSYDLLRELPEETSTVVFVDVGYGNTQVAVVDFIKGKFFFFFFGIAIFRNPTRQFGLVWSGANFVPKKKKIIIIK